MRWVGESSERFLCGFLEFCGGVVGRMKCLGWKTRWFYRRTEVVSMNVNVNGSRSGSKRW